MSDVDLPDDEEGSQGGAGLSKKTGFSSSGPGIVAVRGTGHGLVVRLDGRVQEDDLLAALKRFVSGRKDFLGGSQVTLEWVGAYPEPRRIAAASDLLADQFNIKVVDSRLKGDVAEDAEGERASSGEPLAFAGDTPSGSGLFGGLEAFSMEESEPPIGAGAAARTISGGAETHLWDDPNARLVFSTLRSGQRIETEHSLVICGDVNSGAELIAGGDILVLGTLRGVAHAGAYDETGGGCFIFALNLQPTQLRIGSVISRGPADGGEIAEIARVEGDIIVVEPYQSRGNVMRKVGSQRSELQRVHD